MNHSQQNKSLWLALALPISYMLALYIVSSRPVPVVFHIPVSHIDKVYHAIAYSILGFLWARFGFIAFKKTFGAYWMGFFMTSFYAVSDEIHQLYVPARNGDFADVLADMTGAVIGCCLWFILSKRIRKSKAEKS